MNFKIILAIFATLVLPIAQAAAPSPHGAASEMLVLAVQERRIVSFVYQGEARTVEPHSCGVSVTSGEAVLHGYQIAGGSASGTPPGWRTFSVGKMVDLVVTDQTFAAARADYAAGRPQLKPIWAEIGAEKR